MQRVLVPRVPLIVLGKGYLGAEELVQWQPSRPGWQQTRPQPRRGLPRLSQLCSVVVAEHIDYVDSLRGLPQLHVVRICLMLADRQVCHVHRFVMCALVQQHA